MHWIPWNFYSGKKLHRRSQQPKTIIAPTETQLHSKPIFLEYFQSFHVFYKHKRFNSYGFQLVKFCFYFTNTPSELSACFVFLFSSTFNSPTPAAERWKRVWVNERDADNEQLEKASWDLQVTASAKLFRLKIISKYLILRGPIAKHAWTLKVKWELFFWFVQLRFLQRKNVKIYVLN